MVELSLILRTDKGGEYESNPFNSFCEDHEIIHKTTPSYSLESNGVAKRKNRTLKEIKNAMLVSSGAPLNLWGETIISACHIQNRITYKRIGKTPYELWKGYAPNITYLKVCGCLAKVLSPNLKNENQVLKPLMQCSLAMLRIVRHIRFLLLS